MLTTFLGSGKEHFIKAISAHGTQMGKQQNPPSVMCVCVGGCIPVIAPTAWDYQGKVGGNITMVNRRVLLQELDEKHSRVANRWCLLYW